MLSSVANEGGLVAADYDVDEDGVYGGCDEGRDEGESHGIASWVLMELRLQSENKPTRQRKRG